jgi:hypothetical protein
MKSDYQQLLKSLERKAYFASLAIGVIAIFLISLLLLGVAVVYGFRQQNNQYSLRIFVISLAVGVLGFFGSLIWYVIKTREYMRAESIELDLKYPGFYDYYLQWKTKLDEITSSSN